MNLNDYVRFAVLVKEQGLAADGRKLAAPTFDQGTVPAKAGMPMIIGIAGKSHSPVTWGPAPIG